jgi:magnesium transporter
MTIIDNAVYVDGVRHVEPETLEQTLTCLPTTAGWPG